MYRYKGITEGQKSKAEEEDEKKTLRNIKEGHMGIRFGEKLKETG